MSTCPVCLDTVTAENLGISCPLCDQDICVTCASPYVQVCLDGSKLPKCPSVGCEFVFTVSFFTGDLEKLIPRMTSVLVEQEKNPTDEMLSKLELQEKIALVREKYTRSEATVCDSLPLGLRSVFKLVSKNKTQSLVSAKTKELVKKHSEKESTFRECSDQFCIGFINLQTGKCNVCMKKMCKTCEQLLNPGELESHVCKPEIVESLHLVKTSSMACPSCKVLISKSFGCDHMYCINCHTHFSYSSGQRMLQASGNPEEHDYRNGKVKAAVLKAHGAPPLDLKMIDSIGRTLSAGTGTFDLPDLYDNAYKSLSDLKTSVKRVDRLKEQKFKKIITADQFAEQINYLYEMDYADGICRKILLDLVQEIFNYYNHAHDRSKSSTHLDYYLKTKNKLNPLYFVRPSKFKLP